jgi:SWI/SNF-related matrix-associated actin-dependent regulator of chromatin subfamily B protein 1
MPPRSTPTVPTSVGASPKQPPTPTPSTQNKQWQYRPDGSLEAPWPTPAASQHVRSLLAYIYIYRSLADPH